MIPEETRQQTIFVSFGLSGKGSLVTEYRGEVISQNLFLECTEGIYKNNKNSYFLEFEKGEVIDAYQKGTNAHFYIPVGAEISYDYNFSSFQRAQKQVYRCGALNCHGYIGGRLDTEMSSLRFGQMPTVGQIWRCQSDKYKLGKMIAIRFTRLFLFRNIQVVESKRSRAASAA
ncbi:Histone-Lysine N-Methyltransferase ash1l [Podila horticola]|nr:Histone-Lysine N-Methyltransferase ash1l [Podila horticola]